MPGKLGCQRQSLVSACRAPAISLSSWVWFGNDWTTGAGIIFFPRAGRGDAPASTKGDGCRYTKSGTEYKDLMQIRA